MNAFFYHNKLRGCVCLLLAALLLLCACRRGPVAEETTLAPEATTEAPLPEGSITVPYTELDSLNPFFTETLMSFNTVFEPKLFSTCSNDMIVSREYSISVISLSSLIVIVGHLLFDLVQDELDR